MCSFIITRWCLLLSDDKLGALYVRKLHHILFVSPYAIFSIPFIVQACKMSEWPKLSPSVNCIHVGIHQSCNTMGSIDQKALLLTKKITSEGNLKGTMEVYKLLLMHF